MMNDVNQPYALALCLLSIFVIFIVELVAFRWGTSKLEKIGLHHGLFFHSFLIFTYSQLVSDNHGHNLGSHAAHGPEGTFDPSTLPDSENKPEEKGSSDIESAEHSHHAVHDSAAAQIIGIAILEFGVVLHR